MFPLFRLFLLAALLLLGAAPLYSQHSMGMTGLLNIPSADMQADGTFMTGADFLPMQMMPEPWDYHTGNYFVNMTFMPFFEVGYRCTLSRLETGKWNQDRSVSLRIRPLSEGRYWPSVVIGSNDALTTGHINTLSKVEGNRYFSAVYGVATKHFRIGGHDLGLTAGYNIPFRQSANRDGLFGGVAYSPAFCRWLSLMAEYDDRAINIGVSVCVLGHFTAHLFCYDGKAVAGGLRYELCLLKKKGGRR